MSPLLDPRRRRAYYRASHRGTKEMDWLLGRYAEARIATMTEAELQEFETLLSLPDPELQGWLMTGDGYQGNSLAGPIESIRAHHGLQRGDTAP